MKKAISAPVCALSTLRERITRLILLAATLALLLSGGAVAQTSRANSAKSYVARGNEWMKKGEIERAIADYDVAIASDSRIADAYYNRGLARRRKGDADGALSDYDRAIELNPRYFDAYLN